MSSGAKRSVSHSEVLERLKIIGQAYTIIILFQKVIKLIAVYSWNAEHVLPSQHSFFALFELPSLDKVHDFHRKIIAPFCVVLKAHNI